MRSSASARTLPIIEASSTARTAPPYSARARASRAGSERSAKRVRKYCSVRVGMPASLARTRAATAEGARPCIFRSPARVSAARVSAARVSPRSSFTSLSMVVLPLPAWPCTPITRSFDNSTARTASLWPRVRRDTPSRASTASASASAVPLPRPARIDASTRRSAFTARSVTKARSIPRRSTSISSPPDTSRAIAASTSASV